MDISVLHVAQPTDGGVAVVAARLAAHQAALGWPVALACAPFEAGPAGPDRGRPSRLARTAEAAGVRVLDWQATRSPGRSTFAEARRLRELIDQVEPDLVHLHSAKAGLAGRLALRGSLPTVFQPHAWSFEAVSGPTRAAALRWERWATRWTDLTVCVSDREQRDGERAGVRGNYAVVPNGVDPAVFSPGPRDRARARLDLPADRPLALVVGRLCPQKGQDLLLEVWPTVLDRVPRARLALVGDGPDRDLLRDLIASRPRLAESVLLPGATEDATSWYRAADLLVVPSRWEGMALAPLEAMACGCPVVAFEVAGIRESLPPGWAGWALAEPGNGPALAALVSARLAATGRALTEAGSATPGDPGTRVPRVTAGAPGTGLAREPHEKPDTSRRPEIPDKPDPPGYGPDYQPDDRFAVEARDRVLNHHTFAEAADAMCKCYSKHLRDRRSRLHQTSNL